MAKIIRDPLNNEIFIPQTVLDFDKQIIQLEDVMDDISKVIEKPIMIFRSLGSSTHLFYLRAIGWNKTMLIEVKKNTHHYEVTGYELDPPIERITELHSTFERLI